LHYIAHETGQFMATQRTLEDDVKQLNRKPFVVPTVKELASLSSVTLVSGGGGGTPTRHGHSS
jgi:hypothetical protein